MTLLEIGQALRQARKARKMTLQHVADALGMGIATLSRLERGELEDISAGRLLRVADYVGMQRVVRPAGFGMTLDEAMADADGELAVAKQQERP